MNKSEKILKSLETTKYWDSYIWDFRFDFLGSEITIFVEDVDNPNKVYVLTFYETDEVSYKNGVNEGAFFENKSPKSQNMVPYHGQNMKISMGDDGGYLADLVLDPLYIKFKFKDVQLNHLEMSEVHFFWQGNE